MPESQAGPIKAETGQGVPAKRPGVPNRGTAASQSSRIVPEGIDAETFNDLVDKFVGLSSGRQFKSWKTAALKAGVSPANISEAVYQGSLERGENLWGDNWKRYYEEISGTEYPGGTSHAHHLVEKKGESVVAEQNRQILREVGIDPYLARENLTWAPNVVGQHGLTPQRQLLQMLSPVRGNREGIIGVLRQWSDIAKSR